MKKFIQPVYLFMLKRRVIFLILLGLLLLFSGYFLKNYTVDNTLNSWFLRGDETTKNYNEFKKQFGNDESITIAFKDEKSILSTENYKILNEVTKNISKNTFVEKVYTYLNTPNKSFLSKDKKTTIILVILKESEDFDSIRGTIISQIKSDLDSTFSKYDKQYYLAGLGVVYNELNRISLDNSTLFIVLSYLIVFIILVLSIRKFSLILIALGVVYYSLITSLGIFFLFGKSINMVTMVLPSLILIFSLSDIIHIMQTFFYKLSRMTPEERANRKGVILSTMLSVIRPCLLTSLTTAIGFSSLLFSKIQLVKDLGLFTAIGVMVEFLVTFSLTPLLLSFVNTKKIKSIKNSNDVKKESILSRIIFVLLKHKIILIAIFGVIFIFSGIGISKLKVDTFSINFLKKSNRVVKDSVFIENNFGNYSPVEIVVTGKRHIFLNPEVLQTMNEFCTKLETHKDIDSTVSLLSLYSRLNSIDNTNDIKSLIDRNFTKYNLRHFITPDYGCLRITAMSKMMSAIQYKELLKFINSIKNNYEINGVRIKVSGYIPLYVKMINYITQTQISSFTISFILIFLIIFLYARSFKLGLLALLVNLFPVGFVLGIMGLFGIRLDIATVIIGAIALGIVVDDTIHILYRYKKEQENSNDFSAIIRNTIEKTIRPVFITSLSLTLGFAVLLFAEVKSVIYFGLLSILVIVMAFLADSVLLPALLSIFSKSTDKTREITK